MAWGSTVCGDIHTMMVNCTEVTQGPMFPNMCGPLRTLPRLKCLCPGHHIPDAPRSSLHGDMTPPVCLYRPRAHATAPVDQTAASRPHQLTASRSSRVEGGEAVL